MEKLVDIVTFIHQEIPEAFGDNGIQTFYIHSIVYCICPLYIEKRGDGKISRGGKFQLLRNKKTNSYFPLC